MYAIRSYYEFKFIGNGVFKFVKCPLVNFARQPAIDFHFGIGHHTFKYNFNIAVFPVGRYRKLVLVQAIFAGLFFQFVASIIVGSKPLLFPAGGHTYFGPLATFAAIGTKEIPFNQMIFIGTGEVFYLCSNFCLTLCTPRNSYNFV